MDKPITILADEFKRTLAGAINNSGLPTILIEPILADVLREVKAINAQQLAKDKMEWEVAQEGREN